MRRLIAGGGFAGLSLAIALKQSLGDAFAVTVADPTLGRTGGDDLRASAIAAAARRMFEAIGAWDAVVANAQPILDMVVTDSKLNDAVRPAFLTFDGDIEPGEPFAHMIENGPLNAALAEKAKEAGRRRCAPRAVSGFETHGRIGQSLGRRRRDWRGSWSRPTARARGCASRPASRPTAGATASRRSSRRWRTSAITTAAPRSISCLRGRSRSCR